MGTQSGTIELDTAQHDRMRSVLIPILVLLALIQFIHGSCLYDRSEGVCCDNGNVCATGSFCRSKYLVKCKCIRPQTRLSLFIFMRGCSTRCSQLCHNHP